MLRGIYWKAIILFNVKYQLEKIFVKYVMDRQIHMMPLNITYIKEIKIKRYK